MESNSSLNKLAIDVLKKYNIVPDSISIIQSGSIKTVWKITFQGKTLCLKRLKQTLDKAQFSVNAQIYIKNSKGNVPAIILDKDSSPIVQHNNELFVVYEWLLGRDLNFNNSEDLSLALQGLAKFHLASKGYKANGDSRISSKANKSPDQYNSMKNRFIAWKESCRKNSSPSHAAYLKYADSMIEISDMALELISKSSYKDLVSENSNSIVLCHQDFGVGNAILTKQGIIVLDLDGVTFDLPIRDLRKIIGKQAQNHGKWDIYNISNILKWYSIVNPISDKEKEVLYIDLLFPHWFFGALKNQFQNGKVLKPAEIERVSRLEQSKVSILKDLLKRR